MRTTANNNANTTSNHNGENWPYHQYEGSNPSLIGSYVPCATNPCTLHGGSDVYATSAEEAYTKAHQNDTWGFTVQSHAQSNKVKTTDNVNDKAPSNTETSEQSIAHGYTNVDTADIDNNPIEYYDEDELEASLIEQIKELPDQYDELDKAIIENLNNTDDSNSSSNSELTGLESNDNVNNASNANTINDNASNATASNNSKELIANSIANLTETEANDGYTSIKARNIAIEQGLYINGSPLLHRLTTKEQKKYRASGYNSHLNVFSMTALAHDIFPGAIIPEPHGEELNKIQTASKNIISKATTKEVESLKDYTNLGYKYVNNILRNQDVSKDLDDDEINKYNNEIKNISSLMNRSNTVISKDTVVLRRRFMVSTNSDERGSEEKAFYQAVAKSMRDGSEPIITRPDFMSTTWNVFDEELDDARYLIKIPKGTKALDISDVSEHPHESELLIDKGYRLKVVGIYEFDALKVHKNSIYDPNGYNASRRSTEWRHNHPVIALELIPPEDDDKQ